MTVVAVILFIIKMVAWWITKSVSILTDALESTVNVIAGVISLYSIIIAAKPKDADHPYGHGKAEFVSAAVEGSLIFVAGVVIIIESVRNYFDPHPITQLDAGIILISATALINFILGTYALKTGVKNNSLALIASGNHLRTDTLSTVGIIAGLVLIYFTGWKWVDGAVAMLFALIIIFTGAKIVRRSLAGIMDESDTRLLQQLVEKVNAGRNENWIDLHKLRIIKFGAILHVDCHLTVPWYLTVKEAHEEVDRFSALVKREFGDSVELFVHSDGCENFSCPICIKFDCRVRQAAFQHRLQWTSEMVADDSKHRLTSNVQR